MSEQSAETTHIEDVLAGHVLAEWREVHPETFPGADDGRYGRFCSCGQMLDAAAMDASFRAHVAEQMTPVLVEAARAGRRATLDPGAFTKRPRDDDGEYLRLDRWQERALILAVDQMVTTPEKDTR